MRLLAPILLSISTIAATYPTVSHTTHEKRSTSLIAWKKDSRASKAEVLPVRIGLTQRNLEHGDRFLHDISDPDSPNFGKHWTAEQVANTFAPHPTTTDTTLAWLHEAGIEDNRIKHSVRRNWIEFSATVGELEELLHTEYHNYQHKQSGGYRIACDEYKIPQHVRQHVDFITPTIQLEGLRPVARATPAIAPPATNNDDYTMGEPDDLARCQSFMSIHCLRALYNIPLADRNNTGNELGIYASWDHLYAPDLPVYYKNWTSPQIPSDVEPEFISIYGGKRGTQSMAEANRASESALDIQTTQSIIYPQKVRLYQVGASEYISSFNIFLDALDASYCTYQGGNEQYLDPGSPDSLEEGYTGDLQCGGAPRSNVISISYVITAGASQSYQERQCFEWMKLGLQGVSVIVGSGDSGVGRSTEGGNWCLNAETGEADSEGTRFSTTFPSSCPYVTSVGATTLLNQTIASGEKAVDHWSGSGFSSIFPRPSYQDEAVSTYLSQYAPAYGEEVYDPSGRAYPDVSANGLFLPAVVLNETISLGGTSASTPIFASIVNMLNEERLEAGKGPIGFLNPIIYKHPEMFNDIVVGHNDGCGTDGFPTSPGWDPVTGHGTPRYEEMRKVFLALP